MANLLTERKKTTLSSSNVMPDISYDVAAEVAGPLDRVGMSEIEIPVLIRESNGELFRQPAKVEAFVSLDQPTAKGIHMSRLYLTLRENLKSQPLSFVTIRRLLEEFVKVQKGLSHSAYLRIEFQKIVEREALLSQEKGWRQYPVYLSGKFENNRYEFAMGVQVMYSSTCPCSAALAQSLVQEKLLADFAVDQTVSVAEIHEWLGQQNLPTPHAQRSIADIDIKFKETPQIEVIELINRVERELGTPVQAAVKRQDEQEFARLNGENLMFCEDAARKIRAFLESDERVADYRVCVKHVESLHPHSAVAKVVKGVSGGYTLD